MPYTAGFLNKLIQVQNRSAATDSRYGLDGQGIEWVDGDFIHANVTYAKGVRALNSGALDVYMVKKVRMRWTDKITLRSRVKYQGEVYQIIPETFHEDFQDDSIQFDMQLVINE
jgi:head-tail adaptor